MSEAEAIPLPYDLLDTADLISKTEKPSSKLEKIAMGAGCAVIIPFAAAALVASIPVFLGYQAWHRGMGAYYGLRGKAYPAKGSVPD